MPNSLELTLSLDEGRMCQECFLWFWSTRPRDRHLLILIYNNPRNKITGALLKAMGLRAGRADYLYLKPAYNGLFLPCWLEAKTAKGTQSPEQKKFQQDVEKAGHVYKIFRSLEEFQNLIQNQDAILRRRLY